MEADFSGAVEQLTGCTVIGFISSYCVEPDILAELFALDARLTLRLRSNDGPPAYPEQVPEEIRMNAARRLC